LILLASTPAFADDWPMAHPRGWFAQGMGTVAEVFPPQSRNNAGTKPVMFVYDIQSAGNWKTVTPKLLWKVELANREAPYEALVADGWVITLDDWANLGYDHAVVIYDPKGKLVASKKLDDMLPADVANKDRSVSSRYWRRDAKYLIDLKGKQLHVMFKSGGYLRISLADGKHEYSATPPTKLPAGSETAVWQLDLRFSSITDVIAAKKSP
jgi:hypothetical protein